MKKFKLRKIKKSWIAGGVVICVLVIAVIGFTSRKSKVRGEEGSRQMEASVTTGTIQTSVSGTGTISYADSTEIILPSDLVIDEMLVSEGSSVTAGTLLATVDEASLAACLNEVEEAISDADSTISSESSTSSSQSIKAGVAGRVKKIYADEDDSVADVMREEGALMLLSVDDLMAVKLTGVGNISIGDEVKVSSGDTKTDGTVESVDSDGAVIIFDDSVFDYEEEVTVANADGVALGQGTAYIHQMIQVVGSSGTISSINVSLNSSVSASTKVYTLDSNAKSAEYMQAVKERQYLVSLLDTLISIQTDGGITAATDGMLESVNITTSSTSSTVEQSSSNTGYTVSEKDEEKENMAETDDDTTKGTLAEAAIVKEDVVDSNETSKDIKLTSGSTVKTSGFMAVSANSETSQLGSSESGKSSVDAPADLSGGAGVITGTTTEMEYAPSENADSWTTCTAGSTKVAAGIWYVRYKETDKANASAAVQITVTEESTEQNTQDQTGNKDTLSQTDNTTEKTDTDGKTDSKENNTGKTSGTMPDNTASGSNTNKNAGGSASAGSASTSVSSSSDSTTTASLDTVSAFVIANGDKMKVTMNVDELDIGSMQEGLSAEITLDAVEGETFTGNITSVSGSASAGNGVAQYPVEITFDKTEDMLSGMNASVAVIVEQAENVLVVPLAAVTDMGDKAYVYTGYDESSGELTGETEVTLGLSDENNVEIKSGLSEGDTIYYQVMGSEDNGTDTGKGMGGFDMKGMGGMSGDAPDDSGKQFKDGGGSGNGGGPGNGGMPGGGSQ